MGLGELVSERFIWPLWTRRDHPRLLQYAEQIAHRQFDLGPVRTAWQSVMLQCIVRHAATTVPYYREILAERGLSAADFRTPRDLQRLPVLTKTQLRKNADELLSDLFRDQPTVTKTTSGSTGVPLRIKLDMDGLAWKRAATLVADEWSGWRRGQRVAKLWGAPDYLRLGWKGRLRNRLLDRAIHLNTLKMSKYDVTTFARRMARFEPKLIFGHAHSLAVLASVIRDRDLPRTKPTGIISTAMVLHDYQRKLIEDVFDCRVTNRYGCEEVSLIACECPAHAGMHVNDESVFVELLERDCDRPVSPGQPGRVVVTDLANYAMPLLRYEVGDVAAWSAKPCTCGRESAVLESVAGRVADYVVTASGHYVSGISLSDAVSRLIPSIAQLQIVQESVDRFCFRIVADESASVEYESHIERLVQLRFGPAAQFRCEYLSAIPQEASGKYRFCISHVTGLAEGRAA